MDGGMENLGHSDGIYLLYDFFFLRSRIFFLSFGKFCNDLVSRSITTYNDNEKGFKVFLSWVPWNYPVKKDLEESLN